MKRKKPKPWQRYEVRWLHAFANDGDSSTAAGKFLNRSPGAVRQKAREEGIRFHSLGRRHSQLQKARYAK